jgi:hypothetical protein
MTRAPHARRCDPITAAGGRHLRLGEHVIEQHGTLLARRGVTGVTAGRGGSCGGTRNGMHVSPRGPRSGRRRPPAPCAVLWRAGVQDMRYHGIPRTIQRIDVACKGAVVIVLRYCSNKSVTRRFWEFLPNAPHAQHDMSTVTSSTGSCYVTLANTVAQFIAVCRRSNDPGIGQTLPFSLCLRPRGSNAACKINSACANAF